MKQIHFCAVCKTFTLEKKCVNNHITKFLSPPKYSPTDKYGGYRRKFKRKELVKKGLL